MKALHNIKPYHCSVRLAFQYLHCQAATCLLCVYGFVLFAKNKLTIWGLTKQNKLHASALKQEQS